MQQRIYIIGAQCTGKTTLVNALQAHFLKRKALGKEFRSFEVVPEVARQVLGKRNLTGIDILLSNDQALQLQEEILQAQYTSEIALVKKHYIADRSGIDAIVYAERYAGWSAAQKIIAMKEWKFLRSNMRQGLVVVCEPVRSWLQADGLRLMPTCDEDWMSFHHLFIRMLDESGLSYYVIPSSLKHIEERVDFILQRLQESTLT